MIWIMVISLTITSNYMIKKIIQSFTNLLIINFIRRQYVLYKLSCQLF